MGPLERVKRNDKEEGKISMGKITLCSKNWPRPQPQKRVKRNDKEY